MCEPDRYNDHFSTTVVSKIRGSRLVVRGYSLHGRTWAELLVFQGVQTIGDVAILKQGLYFDGFIQPFDELQITCCIP
jgi:hypothetical protein